MRFSKDSKDRFRALSLLGWKIILVVFVASLPFQCLGIVREMAEQFSPALARKGASVELVILLVSLSLGPFWIALVYLNYHNWLQKSIGDLGLDPGRGSSPSEDGNGARLR